jgi:hypothetical protein
VAHHAEDRWQRFWMRVPRGTVELTVSAPASDVDGLYLSYSQWPQPVQNEQDPNFVTMAVLNSSYEIGVRAHARMCATHRPAWFKAC